MYSNRLKLFTASAALVRSRFMVHMYGFFKNSHATASKIFQHHPRAVVQAMPPIAPGKGLVLIPRYQLLFWFLVGPWVLGLTEGSIDAKGRVKSQVDNNFGFLEPLIPIANSSEVKTSVELTEAHRSGERLCS